MWWNEIVQIHQGRADHRDGFGIVLVSTVVIVLVSTVGCLQ